MFSPTATVTSVEIAKTCLLISKNNRQLLSIRAVFYVYDPEPILFVQEGMDTKTLFVDHVFKYMHLLNKLPVNQNALASLKSSILCSEHNENGEIFRNNSTLTGNYCQHCLITWQDGHFIVKTLQKKKVRNDVLKRKKRSAHSTFIVVIKCLICLNKTSYVFNKNKVLNNKPVIKTTNSMNIKKTLSIKDVNNICTKDKKKLKKKKKKNIYAGLNPLVFENTNLCKKNRKNL